MRKKINPLILFGFFGIIIFILILNRPRFEDHPVKTKSNIAQVETQALHNIDKPVIDVSGWQRPEEINYDTLSQNISGAIVRVHSGAQSSKENDASFVNGVDKAFKTHITEFQKRNVPVGVYAYVAGKNVQEMEKAAEVFYNTSSPYSPSYYWLDVEDKTMSNMNEGVEAFRAKLESLGAKNIGIYVGVYFMEEHSIDTDKFTSVWIPSYGSDSGFYEATPKTDLDYDIHQYTSKGKIAGFDHDLDINVISSLKNKEETFRKIFLKP
ncbi:glycoside hydrolase family 25 protein [uncultured Streptococcus sp.]|uniref:glycoside hydrolase family 25 protein n=1 Tax=uncultured Streptococcus sp. TaxID=83427 RepID=UPI0028D5D60D|nr:glycoside hydrolase family 25 protein [uncultured Streptococcus sp.]